MDKDEMNYEKRLEHAQEQNRKMEKNLKRAERWLLVSIILGVVSIVFRIAAAVLK